MVFWNDTLARCEVPPGCPAGDWPVRLWNPALGWSASAPRALAVRPQVTEVEASGDVLTTAGGTAPKASAWRAAIVAAARGDAWAAAYRVAAAGHYGTWPVGCAAAVAPIAGVQCCTDGDETCVCTEPTTTSLEDAFTKYVAHAEAAEKCAALGRRLCTLAELRDNRCVDNGCHFRHAQVWTPEPCGGEVDGQMDTLPAGSAILSPPFVLSGSSGIEVELPGPADAPCADGRCGGALRFFLRCNASATLTIGTDVLAPDSEADMLRIRVDTGWNVNDWPPMWAMGHSSSWQWAPRSPSFEVGEGAHEVVVNGVEDGLKLRAFRLETGGEACGWQTPQELCLQVDTGYTPLDMQV